MLISGKRSTVDGVFTLFELSEEEKEENEFPFRRAA